MAAQHTPRVRRIGYQTLRIRWTYRSTEKRSSTQRRPANSANAKRSYEKYVTLARAAALSGDVVETENYYQHAEHYFRLMKEERTRSGQEEVDGTPGVEANEQPS